MSSTRPSCASAIALHDREAEPRALGAPRFPSTMEALEDRALLLHRDARGRGRAPRSEPRRRRRAIRARSARPRLRVRTAFSASCMTACVRRCRSATIVARAEARRGPVARRERRHLGVALVRQPATSTGAELQEVGLLVLGEEQQVFDDPRHPVELVDDERERRLPLLGVVVEQLEVAADDRERRPAARGPRRRRSAAASSNARSSRSSISLNVTASCATWSRPAPGCGRSGPSRRSSVPSR